MAFFVYRLKSSFICNFGLGPMRIAGIEIGLCCIF